jgi:hypothetical protein
MAGRRTFPGQAPNRRGPGSREARHESFEDIPQLPQQRAEGSGAFQTGENRVPPSDRETTVPALHQRPARRPGACRARAGRDGAGLARCPRQLSAARVKASGPPEPEAHLGSSPTPPRPLTERSTGCGEAFLRLGSRVAVPRPAAPLVRSRRHTTVTDYAPRISRCGVTGCCDVPLSLGLGRNRDKAGFAGTWRDISEPESRTKLDVLRDGDVPAGGTRHLDRRAT